jgi:hypothetical protein
MSETAEITEESLRACIYNGDTSRILALLEHCDSAELKHFQKLLTRISKEQRELERTDWKASRRLGETLIVAGVLCSDTPAQAAGWLGRRRLFDLFLRGADGPEELLLSRHDVEWNRELAMRLSEKLRADNDDAFWQFIDNLATRSGARPPITPAYINGWLWSCRSRLWDLPRGEQAPLTQWLREQPRLRECVAGLFTTDGAGSFFTAFQGDQLADEEKWPKAIARLAAGGELDRAELIDGCAARLLRGDRPGSLRGYLDIFEELAPTRAEVRERLGTYQSLATSAPGVVAKLALGELRALDKEKPAEPLDLAAFSEAVLARPESGLANAQLAWLDAAIKRDRGAAAVLLPVFGSAFTHPATSVQQRALKLLGKHLKATKDQATVSLLREAALSVDPALKAEAAALFADFAVAESDAGPLPMGYGLPEYQPAAVPPMPSTPEELVTALAPSYNGGRVGPLEAEQIMAAIAVLSHRDLGRLAEVFRPLYDRYDDDRHGRIWPSGLLQFPEALRCLLEAVLGKDRRKERIRIDDPLRTTPKIAIVLRIQELTDQLLRRKTVPFLLATPTEVGGAIDPAVLEGRIATYRELGIKPLPLDLEHAQLRATPDPLRTKALAELPIASAVGEGSATWMSAQGSSFPGRSRRKSIFSFRPAYPISSLLLPDLVEKGTLNLPQPPIDHWNADQQHDFASIMLPHDPDLVAAYAMTLLHSQANERGSRTAPLNIFPALAETAGVPGPLTHLALAYALAADTSAHRIAAQDAALTFAARNLLRGDLLGRIAVLAWQRDLLRGKRFIDALSQLEQSGASAQVFETAATMISALSKEPETRGLPELLLLATRCAVGAGPEIRGVEIPGLADLAALTKPKRVGIEARRLQESLSTNHSALL